MASIEGVEGFKALASRRILASGAYHIFAMHSGRAIDVPGSTNETAQLIQWKFHGGVNQSFALHAAPDGAYFIQSLCCGLFWDIEAGSSENCASVLQFKKHGGENQQFLIQSVDGGHFKILAKHLGKAIDI